MMLPRRYHSLRNNTAEIIYVREVKRTASEGSHSHETRLEPYSVIRIPATKFLENNQNSGCQSSIDIFWGERKAHRSLEPEKFVQFFELIFDISEDVNALIVYGIPAKLSDYFPNFLKAFSFSSRDHSDRSRREIVRILNFKELQTANKGCLLTGLEMTTIHILINYDGKWENNEKGGYTWSCGANTKHAVINVDGSNLSLQVVGNEICETLGLNGLETKLKFSYLPPTERFINPCPIYIQNLKSLTNYLSFGNHGGLPMLHVENAEANDETCGEN